MLPSNNPYTFSPLETRPDDPTDHPDFGRVLHALAATRPWVRLLGVSLVITPLVQFFSGARMTLGIIRFGSRPGGGLFSLILLGIWGVSIVGYSIIGFHLLSYASRIRRAEVSLNMTDVAAAIEKQQTLWKYAALFVIFTLVLSSVPIIIVLLPWLMN